MHRAVAVLVLLFLSACASTEPLSLYDYDLVSVTHNSENGYTLLVYRDTFYGEVIHDLRREGLCELVMIYTPGGEVKLKRRGREAQTIDAVEAGRLTEKVNALLREKTPEVPQPTRSS